MSTMLAKSFLDKAEKKIKAGGGGWFSFSNTSKYEEAGDLFQQAANAFKLEKKFAEAGDAFSKEAECRENQKESNEAANAWWNAAKAFKQAQQVNAAVSALEHTIKHMTQGGRFRQAADREKEIAQIYLDAGDLNRASESYVRAAEWYSQEDANATANACYKDAADIYAQLDSYPQAILLYEKVADYSFKSALTKYSVKDYWLKAGLCALANGDAVTADRNMKKYSVIDNTFASTRESKFVNELISAVNNGDQEQFAEACHQFNQVMQLDNWKVAVLTKIKKTINEEPGLT